MMQKVDFHCHILPCADHGSDSIEQSLEQIALLKNAGIAEMVATPHFYPNAISVNDFLRLRTECAASLMSAIDGDVPTIYPGAEVLFCPGIEEMAGLEQLCIAGTNTLLLEMPMRKLTDTVYDAFERLTRKRKDIRIVLAHIDRYDSNDISELMNFPVFAQINAHELDSRSKRKWLSAYIKADRVVALATDLHGVDKKRIKAYHKGLAHLDETTEDRIYRFSRLLLKGAKPFEKE